MANTVIIHIGVPKTGSTAIQKYLFNHQKELQKTGLDYHETHAKDGENPDYWAHHLLAHKWGGWMKPETFPITPDEAWEVLRKDATSGDNKTILISSERFADLFASKRVEEILEFIKTTLAPAQVKIFAYVRNQTVLAESFYKQQVKVGIQVPPVDFYLKTKIPGFLDFYGMFEKCAKVIGRENIMVRSYENDIAKDGDIIYGFMQVFGMKVSKKMQPESVKYNTSTSTLSTALLSHPDLKKMRQYPRFRKAIRDLCDDLETKSGQEPSLFNEEQKDFVSKKYLASNRQMVDIYAKKDADMIKELEEVKKTSTLEDERFMVSYDDLLTLFKVFNEDLEDLSEKK